MFPTDILHDSDKAPTYMYFISLNFMQIICMSLTPAKCPPHNSTQQVSFRMSVAANTNNISKHEYERKGFVMYKF